MAALHVGWVIFVVALGWLSYRNALTAELVFDDHLAIEQNADANSSTPLRNIWRNDFWVRTRVRARNGSAFTP